MKIILGWFYIILAFVIVIAFQYALVSEVIVGLWPWIGYALGNILAFIAIFGGVRLLETGSKEEGK